MRDAIPPCAAAFRSATSLLAGYGRGEISPREVAELSLSRIAAGEPALGAMIAQLPEAALAQAEASVARWAKGEARPLEGVPVTIKDTFDLAGAVSTRGSRVFAKHLAYEDSGVVRRLRAAGAVLVGKTNTAEFGQSATSENLLELVTRNPWNPEMTPGGSSGGAAV